jgi:hypothetical protein
VAAPAPSRSTPQNHQYAARTAVVERSRAKACGTQQHVVNEIEALATSTDLSIRQIQAKIGGRASRGIVGEITKRARAAAPPAL